MEHKGALNEREKKRYFVLCEVDVVDDYLKKLEIRILKYYCKKILRQHILLNICLLIMVFNK